MTHEDTISAAILGELIPELEYAAPVLLERSNRGDPLVGTTSPTDLGFETGSVDPVLLEFFKALVPHVKTLLSCGVLLVAQNWLLAKRDARYHAELVAILKTKVEGERKVHEAIDQMRVVLSRMDGAPVTRDDVAEWIAAAIERIAASDEVVTRR